MGIELLDPRNRPDVDAVVALRRECFPGEHPAGLRDHLWRHHVLSQLVEDGLMRCALARKDGKVVGFITYTKYPNTFLATGRKNHRLHLAWTVATGLLTLPDIMVNLSWLFGRRGRSRLVSRPSHLPPDTGEVLLLAVDSNAQAWIPEGGTSRVSMRLIDTAMDYFQQAGMREVFLLVRASNAASNLLCHSLGCRMEKAGAGELAYHHFYYSLDEGAS